MNMENSRFKFRLWCNNKKEWEKDKWHLTPDGRVIDSQRNIEMKKETHFLIQCTGITDINGVPVYEGDILERSDTSKGYVAFSLDGFIFHCTDTFDSFRFFDIVKTSEVIGNIYENPELIN